MPIRDAETVAHTPMISMVAPVSTTDVAPLAVALALFARLEAAGISCCHWKSNEHLVAGLAGRTDLDVLVDRRGAAALPGLLADAGYKRVTAAPERSYPSVENYLALDPATGRLVHLHLHYRLVLGEKYLKGFRLPWEHLALTTRVRDAETGVYTTDPHLELLLLLVRVALKRRRRELPSRLRGRSPLGAGARTELAWLVARVDRTRLATLCTELLGDDAATLLPALLDAPSAARLAAFRRAFWPRVGAHRTFRAGDATRRRWTRELRIRAGKAWSRLTRAPVSLKHTLPDGGVMIALLGSDGAGKSTLVRDITAWLSWKTDVVNFYFGFGGGPTSLLRWPLRLVKEAVVRHAAPASAAQSIAPTPSVATARTATGAAPANRHGAFRTSMKRLFDVLWAWTVVRECRTRLAQAVRARDRGYVVMCDRFPQSQIMALSDGPQLAAFASARSALLRRVSRWELDAYRAFGRHTPDLVIKLHVSPEVATRRKPMSPTAPLERRIAAVRAVRFTVETRVLEIDTDQPYEQVLRQVKQAVWDAL